MNITTHIAGVIVLALAIGVPFSALAYSPKSFFDSVISFSRSIFVSSVVASGGEAQADYGNSQKIGIRAAVTPDQAVGGGDITVSKNALVAVLGPNGSIADVAPVQNSSGRISRYIVREGDTLSQIAGMFGVSVNTIMGANGLARDAHITPGQELLIFPLDGVNHIVKKGDTLSTIARKYDHEGNTSEIVAEIIAYNDLSEDAPLTVGQEIFIPGGQMHSTSHSHTTRVVRTATPSPSYEGYYTHPLPGSRKSQGIHGYNAVDLAAPVGTPVVAAAGGEVIIARTGWNGGYGNYVVIDHNNGTQTVYAHNSSNAVVRGEYVVAGEVIGYVGSTGRSTGPHLHFEIRGAQNPF